MDQIQRMPLNYLDTTRRTLPTTQPTRETRRLYAGLVPWLIRVGSRVWTRLYIKWDYIVRCTVRRTNITMILISTRTWCAMKYISLLSSTAGRGLATAGIRTQRLTPSRDTRRAAWRWPEKCPTGRMWIRMSTLGPKGIPRRRSRMKWKSSFTPLGGSHLYFVAV